ncbi:MAG: cytochrome c biogenesis protein CcdA [Planctomycetota bacterium]|nr:cytochrome c biogenesis protein CcdA [Planctomycetota bacterium]
MKSIWLLCVAWFALVSPTFGDENHAKAALFARAEGTTVKVAVEIRVDKDWHLYTGPTTADVGTEMALPTVPNLAGAGFTWGDWRFPKPEIEEQDFGGDKPVEFRIHRGKIVLYRVGQKTAEAKLDDLELVVSGQTCTDGASGVCLPYDDRAKFSGAGDDKVFAVFPSDLTATPRPPVETATPATAATKDVGSTKTATNTAPIEEDAGNESSLVAFLISAVLWGLFTLLMPCTYPMIPITISYFTKQAEARKTGTLPLSLAYGAGIVGIFVLIGVLVGPLIIPFATHPITNLVIGGFFLVFALTLFGVMTLNPPRFLMSVAGSASQKGGYLGVFLMGATLVITSFTCTAPFVGTLLSTGASSGGLGRIALGMGVFGLTMALPFVWLSMVPAKVKSIPKSGEWMHTLKVFLGFVEVAAALKFLSNADLVWNWQFLSRELFLTLWSAIFFCAAAYLFAWVRTKDEYGAEEPATISPKRMVSGVVTMMLAFYFALGALGHTMDPVTTAIAPNYSSKIGFASGESGSGIAHASGGHVIIKDDFDAALERAKKEGKTLLANFTGFTCVNCRVMEEKVFTLPSVSKELGDKFIEARLHTDGGPSLERNKELQKEYTGSVANPQYVIIDPKTGKKVRKIAGYKPEQKFLEFLRGPLAE